MRAALYIHAVSILRRGTRFCISLSVSLLDSVSLSVSLGPSPLLSKLSPTRSGQEFSQRQTIFLCSRSYPGKEYLVSVSVENGHYKEH